MIDIKTKLLGWYLHESLSVDHKMSFRLNIIFQYDFGYSIHGFLMRKLLDTNKSSILECKESK